MDEVNLSIRFFKIPHLPSGVEVAIVKCSYYESVKAPEVKPEAPKPIHIEEKPEIKS